MTMERWFLFDDGPSTGARNMAVDEVLLGKVENECSAPILRLYSFDPPAVTVGYHQGAGHGLDRERLERDGVDVVKRFTGGRALLHDGELTYCIVAGTDRPPFDTHLQDSFLRISEALVHALRSIGVDARVSNGRTVNASRIFSKPCLDSVSRHEITAGGRKIVASAQRRSKRSFLQHGSILLTPASERIVDYLPGGRVTLAGRATSVYAEIGREVDTSLVRRAVAEGFEEIFRVSFEGFRLSEEEERGAVRREIEIRRESNRSGSREVAV